MEFGPTARQIVGAQCEVEQSVVGVGEVAVVNPYVMAVAHRNAILASLCEDDVSEDDVVLVLHVDAYAVERLAAAGTDDGLVGAYRDGIVEILHASTRDVGIEDDDVGGRALHVAFEFGTGADAYHGTCTTTGDAVVAKVGVVDEAHGTIAVLRHG